MDHLESIIIESCQLDYVTWNDIKETLKAMWRKYHKPNRKKMQDCF